MRVSTPMAEQINFARRFEVLHAEDAPQVNGPTLPSGR